MSKIIEEYYKSANIMPFLLKRKMDKFNQHPDVSAEFEYWIENKTYKSNGCISVEGYTALILAEQFKLLNGEGVFMLLIELKENPQKAMGKIENGFKIK